LLCVFQKRKETKNAKNLILNYFDNVLIFDDKPKEVEGLLRFLNSNDIATTFYTPTDLNSKNKLKYRKLIFCDLHIATEIPDNQTSAHISRVRSILKKNIGKDYGNYGLVMWTSYPQDIEEVKKRIIKDADKYSLPLFIVGLDKTRYISKDKWDELPVDIENEFSGEKSASFFFEWDNIVNKAKSASVESVFSLCRNYEKQNENLPFILSKLGLSYSGIESIKDIDEKHLQGEIINALTSILHYEITASPIEKDLLTSKDQIKYYAVENNLGNISYSLDRKYYRSDSELKKTEGVYFDGETKVDVSNFKKELDFNYAQLNKRTLLDFSDTQNSKILPGNVYKIKNDTFDILKTSSSAPQDSVSIILEVTPPCDFSQNNKILSRVIHGFIAPYSASKVNKYKKAYHYTGLYPIIIDGIELPQIIIFDFRTLTNLKDETLLNSDNFEFYFRAKNNLFADILQKLSSNVARLGLSIIHP